MGELRMRAGIGRLRKGFPGELGPTALHEVPWPCGRVRTTGDKLHLTPPFFLRPLLPKASIAPNGIVRVEVMDFWRGSWILGLRIILPGGSGFLMMWAVPRQIDQVLAWMRSHEVEIIENRATDIARGRTRPESPRDS
jgi:hypothetical protein